jgi:excisionase family DNA binding protein
MTDGAPRGLTRAELMTARELADLLDVPVSTVQEWGRKGTLPRVKLGRHVRLNKIVVLGCSPGGRRLKSCLPDSELAGNRNVLGRAESAR